MILNPTGVFCAHKPVIGIGLVYKYTGLFVILDHRGIEDPSWKGDSLDTEAEYVENKYVENRRIFHEVIEVQSGMTLADGPIISSL